MQKWLFRFGGSICSWQVLGDCCISCSFVTVQLDQRVIELSPLQTVFMISPRWGRHAAVGVQENPETPHQQEHQKQQQESHETKRHDLLCVRSPQEPRSGPGARDGSQRLHLVPHQRAFTHLLSSEMKRVQFLRVRDENHMRQISVVSTRPWD